ncbi:beta strand repeat-containing protein [Stagnihabitans tardus]|uniref:Calcium-binding protein n=1 Tax=Stagnihabitans tardus TaxID=2699202 RepID=A0AAE5BXS4_9RHOB|nr:hypothetical protein [Stagnihabitans tardus]NBZ89658.1 hypothetical protein [Stagnihabitans tardus]
MANISTSQLTSLSSGIAATFSGLQSQLTAQVADEAFPLIGDGLGKAADVGAAAVNRVGDLGAALAGKLADLAATGAEQTTAGVAAALDGVMAAAGWAGTAVKVASTVAGKVTVTLDKATEAGAEVVVDLAKDLAMEGLDITTEAVSMGQARLATGFELAMTLGTDAAGFFIDTTGAREIAMTLTTTSLDLAPTITLGGQDYDLTDAGTTFGGTVQVTVSDPNADGKLRLSETGGDMVSATFDGDAHVALGLDKAPSGGFQPPVGGDLVVDWNFSNATIDPGDDNSGFGGVPQVNFGNVRVDLGTFMDQFLGPLLTQIQAVLEPVQPLIDLLTTRIKVLEAFPGGIGLFDGTNDGEVTLVDILKIAKPDLDISSIDAFLDLVTQIGDWADFISGIDFDGSNLIIGDFSLASGSDIRSLGFDLGTIGTTFLDAAVDLGAVIGGLSGQGWDGAGGGADILDQILGGSAFDLPFLTDPQAIIDLFLGREVDLVTVDLPTVDFHVDKANLIPPIPIFPGINVKVGGGLDLWFDLGFGYSTRGLGAGHSPLDGFFLMAAENGAPELAVSAYVELGVELDAFVASVYGGGNVRGDIAFDLATDLGAYDDRLYLDDFLAAFSDNPFSIFHTSGQISAGFSAHVDVFWGEVWRWDSPRLILGSFNFDEDSTNNALTLAQKLNGVLTVNSGPRTGQLLPGVPIADGEELLGVIANEAGTGVILSFEGQSKEYFGITRIVADGGAMNDILALDETLLVAANFIGGAGEDYLGGGAKNDTLAGGGGRDVLFGMAGSDSLRGGAGNDILTGGTGADTLDGDGGTDTASYALSAAGVTIDLRFHNQTSGGEGFGDVLFEIENLEGSAYGDELTAGDTGSVLAGLSGHDTLTGGDGADYLVGGLGNDVLISSGATGDTLAGGLGGDLYYVNDADDVVDDGAYAPESIFATGRDTVSASVSFDLGLTGGGIEVLILNGLAKDGWANDLDNEVIGNDQDNRLSGEGGADSVTGDLGNDALYGGDGADTLYGGSGDDMLDGGDGIDRLEGGLGGDTYYVTTGDEVIDLINGPLGEVDTIVAMEDFVLGAAARIEVLKALTPRIAGFGEPIDITGNLRAQSLIGNDGWNVLEGAGGADTIDGGDGVDTASYSLSGLGVVVNLAALGTQKGGDAQGDVLTGIENLRGSAFGDTLKGQNFGTQANDLAGGAGNDALWGYAGDDSLWGETGNDTLYGGAGNDLLSGGAGNDSLEGGAGSDAYVVTSGDVITEALGGGVDTVTANEDYTLAAGVAVEVLQAALPEGAEAFLNLALAGNELIQTLIGNAGNNVLDGGAGADTLDGGAGNDRVTYARSTAGVDVDLNRQSQRGGDAEGDVLRGGIVGVTGSAHDDEITGLFAPAFGLYEDNIHEGLGGNDRIIDTLGHNTLYGGLGNDTLLGGQEGSLLAGGDGADSLDGGAGGEGDTLVGGRGDDIYVVTDAEDVVSENFLSEITGSGGRDTVQAHLAWSLATGAQADIEDLVLVAGITGTGNGLGNAVTGNSGANILSGLGGHDTLSGLEGADLLLGGAGDDRLIGGLGDDRLAGGTGADVFVFGPLGGADRVTDFALGLDRIELHGLAADFAALTLTDTGAGVRISAGTVTITLVGHLAAELAAGDFLFV